MLEAERRSHQPNRPLDVLLHIRWLIRDQSSERRCSSREDSATPGTEATSSTASSPETTASELDSTTPLRSHSTASSSKPRPSRSRRSAGPRTSLEGAENRDSAHDAEMIPTASLPLVVSTKGASRARVHVIVLAGFSSSGPYRHTGLLRMRSRRAVRGSKPVRPRARARAVRPMTTPARSSTT